MAGDDDGLQCLSTKVVIVEEDINTKKSTLDLVV